MRFPKISANQICMSPDSFIAKMDIERFGGTAFQKQPIWVGVGTSVYPLNHPWFEQSDHSTRFRSWVSVFDPYRYMPSPFGCHAGTRNGLHEATLPRTWIPVRRSWPHRIHRQNYIIRTESRKGFFTTSSQLDYIRVLLRWERPVGRSDRERPGWNPSFAPPAARDDWEQVGVVVSGTCSFSS